MKENDKTIYWHKHSVSAEDRWESNGYKSCVLWMTGLSASGKSTLANAINKRLHVMGINSYVLDGDNIRHGLNKDLGFNPESRKENIRRIGEVSKCEKRDPKGIYKRVRSGEIKEFTGISAPYEEPETPEIVLETDKMNVDECIEKVLDYLIDNKFIHFIKRPRGVFVK